MNDSGNSDAKAGAQLVAPAQTPTTLDRGPGERALLASVAPAGAQGSRCGLLRGQLLVQAAERALSHAVGDGGP